MIGFTNGLAMKGATPSAGLFVDCAVDEREWLKFAGDPWQLILYSSFQGPQDWQDYAWSTDGSLGWYSDDVIFSRRDKRTYPVLGRERADSALGIQSNTSLYGTTIGSMECVRQD
jgi:hypothetical protein